MSKYKFERRAVIDPSLRYRYFLSREWTTEEGRVCFIMLNPSTADERRDDHTIRKCLNFTIEFGYGSLYVVNLFAFRATDQRNLNSARDPIGPANDEHILWAAKHSECIIAAWGVEKPNYKPRAAAVIRLLRKNRIDLHCLRKTKAGYPWHPLYLPLTSKLELYDREGR